MMFRIPRFLLLFVALATFAAACGDDDETSAGQGGDLPTVVVTTNVLGDVVDELTGDAVNVVTIMPVGADPHDFQASAQQVDEMQSAEVLIVNGGSFEEGLLDIIEAAEADGVAVYEAISGVSTIEFGEGGGHDDHGHDDHEGEEGHDDHDHEGEEPKDEDHDHEGEDHDHEGEEGHDDHEGEEGHDDHDHEGEEAKDEDHDHEGEDHDHEGEEGHDDHEGEEGHDDHDDHGHDDHGHDHSGTDPHFFTDPARMAAAVDGIAEFLIANVEGIDAEAVTESAEEYHEELEALAAEVQGMVDGIAEDDRVLITNHDVFGYFADTYDFEVAGAVIPSGSTQDSTSAAQLAELAELIQDEGVPAIFSDSAASDELIQTLADEVGGDVSVVALFTESLGDADSGGGTYVEMIRTNAERISEALAS